MNIPIDHFNGLRNVELGGSANAEEISVNAHRMGEVVGGALRDAGRAPLELDLIPQSVQAAAVVSARKPYLWVTTVVLALALAGVGMFYKRAAQLTEEKATDRSTIARDLERHDKKISEAKDQLEALNQRKDPYVRAAFERGYWLGVFKDLNDRMGTDRLWITVMEPLSNGVSVIEAADTSGGVPLAAPVVAAEQNSEGKQVDAIRISGLYREDQSNPTQSSQVVVDYFNQLKESPNFAIGDREQNDVIKQMDPSTGDDAAGTWTMEVPLPDDATLRIRYDQ